MHSYVTFVALNKYVGKIYWWEDVHQVEFAVSLLMPVLAEQLFWESLYKFKKSHVQTRAKFCSLLSQWQNQDWLQGGKDRTLRTNIYAQTKH